MRVSLVSRCISATRRAPGATLAVPSRPVSRPPSLRYCPTPWATLPGGQAPDVEHPLQHGDLGQDGQAGEDDQGPRVGQEEPQAEDDDSLRALQPAHLAVEAITSARARV